MSLCCPPGLGCNAPQRDEQCVLELCRAISGREQTAATALHRWEEWQGAVDVGCSRAESRFKRRSYERARAAAMGALVMSFAGGRQKRARRRVRVPSGRSRSPAPRRVSSFG